MFTVSRDENACPTSRPWAVKNSETGKLHGCHATKDEAREQQKALYANVPDAKSEGVMTETREKGKPVGLTPAIKKKFVADLGSEKKNPARHIAIAMQRLSEWAASGHLPTGLSHADCKWMYDQCAKELKDRDPESDAGGDFPGEK